MISCTLNGKKYTVDFISGRALREMESAAKLYARIVRLAYSITEEKEISAEHENQSAQSDSVITSGNIGNTSSTVSRADNITSKADNISLSEAIDTLIRWFCILFNNQFTVDDVLDGYPVDRLMHDIALALMAVQTQTTSILEEFPTKAVQVTTQKETENQKFPRAQTANA